MMTTCFSAMVGFGTGWGSTLTLIVVAAGLTYLMTKRADTASEVS